MNKVLDHWKNLRRRLHERCPLEFILLTFIVVAALPVVFCEACGASLIAFAVLSAVGFALLPWRDAAAGFLAGLTALGTLAFYNFHGSDSLIGQMTRQRHRMTLELEVVDPTLSALDGGASARSVLCRVLRRVEDGASRPLSGSVLLLGTQDHRFTYGDRLQITGLVQLPPHFRARHNRRGFLAAEGLSDFNNYLKSRHIDVTMRPDELTKIRPGNSLLTRIRDRLIERATSGLNAPGSSSMVQALFFGSRQELDTDTRQRLIRSGTMHIFSVSGMHVAVLAFVLLLILRALPFWCRYWLLGALLSAYVVSTGAQVPAVRALIMILVYSFLRMSFHRAKSLKLLLLTAAILLAFNPYELLDAGFFFSFIVTGFLLAVADARTESAPLENAISRYRTAGEAGTIRKLFSRLVWVLIGCLAAFGAGCGISLFAFGMMLPGSIFANLLLIPVLNVLFPVVILKLIFASFAPINGFLALVIDKLFGFFNAIIELAGSWFEPSDFALPALGVVLAFYLTLWLMIGRHHALLRVAAAAAVVGIGVWTSRVFDPAPPAIAVIKSPHSELSTIVLVEPGAPYAMAVNLTPQSAGAVQRILKERGVNQLDVLIFEVNRKEAISGAAQLQGSVDIGQALLLDGRIRSRAFAEALGQLKIPVRALASGEAPGGYRSSLWRLKKEKSGFCLAYSNDASHINMAFRSAPEGALLEIDGRRHEIEPEQSSLVEIFIYE